MTQPDTHSSKIGVASKELCQELYELSGWDDYSQNVYTEDGEVKELNSLNIKPAFPAYDLGYLLRTLPSYSYNDEKDRLWFSMSRQIHGGWQAAYQQIVDNMPDRYYYPVNAYTPEDAACKLAIKLFKQKILTPVADSETNETKELL